MVADANRSDGAPPQELAGSRSASAPGRRCRGRCARRSGGLGRAATSSLTRRIVILNLAGAGRAGRRHPLSEPVPRRADRHARAEPARRRGRSSPRRSRRRRRVDTDAITIDPDKLLELQAGQSGSPYSVGEGAADFPINPERVAPLLRRLISPTRTRARIYDPDGALHPRFARPLYARPGPELRPAAARPSRRASIERWWDAVKLWYRSGELPVYEEIGSANGREYAGGGLGAERHGRRASCGSASDGGLIVSVAVPVQRFRAVLGSLLLSTESGDIDAIVQAERLAIMRVFLVAAVVTVLLSILLASTIAGPVRRLAAAAERVRRGVRHRRAEIPDFGNRKDEIGHLARVLSDMTNALYKRMEAIESFAADVVARAEEPADVAPKRGRDAADRRAPTSSAHACSASSSTTCGGSTG